MKQMSDYTQCIEVLHASTLLTLVEQLVIKGLHFKVWYHEGAWIIELTGGY